MTAATTPAIRTESLSKAFGPTVALDSLTLDVAPGVALGYLGGQPACGRSKIAASPWPPPMHIVSSP
jgi:ABC-type transporter Mla maintaining outer membrane lipid asymmetry ATPase subunit MlaF